MIALVPNEYTKSWIDYYLRPESPAGPREDRTHPEVQFLKGQLQLPSYRRVLDVCCGLGRHAIPLAEAGYEVMGIDRDPELIREAAAQGSRAKFMVLDMRELPNLDELFDAVICMWQSFGFFNDEENESVLRAMAERLRSGGRLILDLYNQKLFEAKGPSPWGEHRTAGVWDWSEQSLYDKRAKRFSICIDWASGERDEFDWRLYSHDEITQIGERLGLTPAPICADFNPKQMAGNRRKSFQVVFEKR